MHPTNTIFENQIAKKTPLRRDLLRAQPSLPAQCHVQFRYSVNQLDMLSRSLCFLCRRIELQLIMCSQS